MLRPVPAVLKQIADFAKKNDCLDLDIMEFVDLLVVSWRTAELS